MRASTELCFAKPTNRKGGQGEERMEVPRQGDAVEILSETVHVGEEGNLSETVDVGGGGGDDYQNLSRIRLVKTCKDRGLDYNGVAEDPEAMRAMLRNNDGLGSGGKANIVNPIKGPIAGILRGTVRQY